MTRRTDSETCQNWQWEASQDITNKAKRPQRPYPSMSRRKLIAVKAFKTGKVAKERRHAHKTLQKRARRSRPEEEELFDLLCGTRCKKEERELKTKSERTPALMCTVNAVLPYSLFGGILPLQLFDNFITDTKVTIPLTGVGMGINVGVNSGIWSDLKAAHPSKCNKTNVTVPALSFAPSTQLNAISFLQQELDILCLLSFSGIGIDDIPPLFYEFYGVEIMLPDTLTPEEMLLLSRHICVFEDTEKNIICALRAEGNTKRKILSLARQEVRLLSLLCEGTVVAGLSVRELKRRYEEKYLEDIILTSANTSLSCLLLSSGRVRMAECCTHCPRDSSYDIVLELIPLTFF